MNLESVARRAGVSAATVSRVLNDVGAVRPATRERVLRAVAALNYHPNLNARTLAGGRSRTLGLIVSNLENPFFVDVFRGLDAEAHERGYELLIGNTDYRPERLAASVRLMIGRRVTGLALVVSEMEPAVTRELAAAGVPVVFYDVGRPGPSFTNLRVDYAGGMEAILAHLRGLGHRRLAFVGHHLSLGPLHERRQAFLRLAASGRPRMEVRTVANADSPTGGQQAVREILASGFEPTAIVAVNDNMALGVLAELEAQGLAVPRDVSVTGFDDIGLAAFSSPALTTVDIPRTEIGRLMCEALLATGGRRDRRIATRLVVRGSTGAAPASGPVPRSRRRGRM